MGASSVGILKVSKFDGDGLIGADLEVDGLPIGTAKGLTEDALRHSIQEIVSTYWRNRADSGRN